MPLDPSHLTTAFHALSFISQRYGVSLVAIGGHCRQRRLVWPRWLAMYLIKRHTPMGLRRLGYLFHRYPTAIQHALRAVDNEVATNRRSALEVASVLADFTKTIDPMPLKPDTATVGSIALPNSAFSL